ncbi:aldo/keto reductase [Pedobacter sp. MR2016-24]|uniref:aldo/keto reductase n=1 Tax=Pedobacter sp. MR2016-24 TaxID=2994466 RepID=UPI002246C009|nr:aldo/keto reductase [Pedobacter sp. MR2016-24]MCX2483245.1 aldo/keto reductase [Pedobacter sp. MR2016-24]
MKYKVLGKTGLFVSEMCLGTMTFGQSAGRYAAASGVTQKMADDIIRLGFDAGINFIDTANVYAGGQSEEIVGKSIRNLGLARKDLVISTKMGHATGDGPNDGGSSRYHIMNQVKESLKRLGTDHIDLYQLHGWDAATPLDETIRALDDLVTQGLVRYIGISNWAAWQIQKALGKTEQLNTVRFESVQAYYSLAGRDLEREILPMLESENLGLMVFSPLAGGYLSGKYRSGESTGRRATIQFPPVDEVKGEPVLAALQEIATGHNTNMPAIALAWLLQKRSVTSVILGVKHKAQLEDNLKAANVTLSEDDIKKLNDASELTPEYPGWMMGSSAPREHLLSTGELTKQY